MKAPNSDKPNKLPWRACNPSRWLDAQTQWLQVCSCAYTRTKYVEQLVKWILSRHWSGRKFEPQALSQFLSQRLSSTFNRTITISIQQLPSMFRLHYPKASICGTLIRLVGHWSDLWELIRLVGKLIRFVGNWSDLLEILSDLWKLIRFVGNLSDVWEIGQTCGKLIRHVGNKRKYPNKAFEPLSDVELICPSIVVVNGRAN